MAADALPPSRARVIIIDDDPSAVECFTQMLLDYGCDVRGVQTMDAGLTEAAADPPDVILLDLHLPGMDGLEGLRGLRSSPLTRKVPVAVVTADYLVDENVVRELTALGARIHFKPVWDTDLRRIVDGLVPQDTGQLR